ncbi:MAG TPA: 6-phosphofructokinase [Syntrophothermus lipocalidus]|uniref:ATP-dependent 6-phosphofructokinase n=1 Tax=Syntrophothermus lipocalidus (strain DSM 12680 / TGB-C1) TaxID=643648 RepID=D7CMF6_SYNLT|nr:6-phosphofructokinase [Syntrophothermus lipocalidus]ADI01891.1 phosphofructokinase [Syntrophothermus lipocalidus DSM 12680]HHV75756.1 6-phosphofructokinase [Syntrophothermus lipocalidus]
MHRIGVITGGGDCPGLNAVVRAVTKSAINLYGWEVIGFEDGFKGLVENRYRILDLQAVSGILHRGGTILGTTNRDNPFNFLIEENGQKEFRDMSAVVLENLDRLGIDALVVIGGDGSLNIAYQLHQKGVKVVGVPKTIDNDLSATDLTFGFHTAVATAMDALDRLHTTAESHHRVMVLEVMGRYAGWIALAAGIAGGADVILIPEIPFKLEKICEKIEERTLTGKKFSIIVVAEGAKPEGGEMVVQKIVPESHDPVRLGGIGNKVGEEIERLTGKETRVTVLGHLQRGGSPNAFDRILSTRYGVAATKALKAGNYGSMVSLQGSAVTTVPLEDAIGELKKVPVDHEMIQVARAVGISFGD